LGYEYHASEGSARRPSTSALTKRSQRAERYAFGVIEKKAASAKPKPEPKSKVETAGRPEHLGSGRPYTGCGDPRRWQQRRRNR
jgi:hypothetical protein